MNVKLLAKITPEQQEAAIALSKGKGRDMDIETEADGELAIFRMSTLWGKTEGWVKRYLSSTFLILASLLVSQYANESEKAARVTMTRTRRESTAFQTAQN